MTDFGNFCIVPVALLIYRMNGRAGNNIVELVEKYALPALVKLLLRILGSRQLGSHCADRLGILIKELALSVVLLVLRLRGVGSSVEFKIKLARPFRKSSASLGFAFKSVKKFACKLPLRLRTVRNAVFQTVKNFNVFVSRSAAAVTVTERHYNLVGKLFLTESLVCSLEIGGSEHRSIG